MAHAMNSNNNIIDLLFRNNNLLNPKKGIL